MSEYSHISIEVEDENGNWSKYLPPHDTLEPAGTLFPTLNQTQNQDSDLILAVQDLTPDGDHINGLVDILNDRDASSSTNWLTPSHISCTWGNEVPFPFSPRATHFDLFESDLGSFNVPQPLLAGSDILSQPSPFYQLSPSIPDHGGKQNRDTRIMSTDIMFNQPPTPRSFTLPSSQQFIRLLLQDAAVAQQNTPGWSENALLPAIEDVLDCLRSLLPDNSQLVGFGDSLEVVPSSLDSEDRFLHIMLYSVANGFAGFQGVPIESIFRLIRSQPQMSSRLFLSLQQSPSLLAKPLADNLFRAAVLACDVQAVETILRGVRGKAYSIAPDDIICEYQDRMFTPVEFAAKLRNTEMVRILVTLGANVNKTYEEDEDLECGALELAIRKGARSCEPVDPLLVQILLEAGAEVRPNLVRRVGRWDSSVELQRQLVEQIRPNAHRSFVMALWYVAEWLDHGIMLQLTKLLFRFCEETCLRCIPSSPNCSCCAERAQAPEPIEKTLVVAARRGNLELLKFLSKYIPRPPDAALSAAIYSGDLTLVDFLITHGAGAKGKAAKIAYESGIAEKLEGREIVHIYTTPLAEAIRSQNPAAMRRVEQLGAWNHLEQPNHFQAAALAAVEVNDTSLLTKILSKYTDESGWYLGPALVEATQNEHTAIVSTLLSAGASVNYAVLEPTHGIRLPLCLALTQRNKNLVNMFLESDIDPALTSKISRECKSPLELASLWGHVSTIKSMISMGFSLDDGKESTAMTAAVEAGNRELVEYLLACGADPSALAAEGISPLHQAVRCGDEDMVRYLLSRGADPADPGAFVESMEKQTRHVAALLRAVTDRYPDGSRGFGADILIKAIEIGDMELLKSLVAAKMDLCAFSNTKHCTALGFAVQHQGGSNINTVRFILTMGVSVNSIVAAPFGRGGAYKHKNSVWPQETALLAAIGTKNEEMVRLILDNGANVNQAARLGIKRTPLQKACETGSFKIVKLLLDRGASVNALPSVRGGGTALQLASGTGSMRIVQLLLSRGADVHGPTSDVQGRSALEAAAENGRLDLLKILWDATNGTGFPAEEIERAVSFAKKKGHGGCAEYIRELEFASKWGSGQSLSQIRFISATEGIDRL